MTDHIAFQGEVQLLNWSETHSGGAKVVLQLADAEDLERFKAMTVKKGKMAGQRLAVVMVEIGEDERPVLQPLAEKVRPGELCVMACHFCKDKQFWLWCARNPSFAGGEEGAKQLILVECGVSSRKELDTDKMASIRFRTLIREPFMTWRDAQ